MLVALLSAVLLGGAQGASCAMHGLGAATQGAMMDHGDMAGHAGMVGMSHDGGSTDAGEHHGCCSCIGAHTTVAPLASAPITATLRVTLAAPEPDRPLDVEPRRPPTAEPDRLLPFANGPPPSVLV